MVAIVIVVCLVSACLLWQFAYYLGERPQRIKRDWRNRSWWQ